MLKVCPRIAGLRLFDCPDGNGFRPGLRLDESLDPQLGIQRFLRNFSVSLRDGVTQGRGLA